MKKVFEDMLKNDGRMSFASFRQTGDVKEFAENTELYVSVKS